MSIFYKNSFTKSDTYYTLMIGVMLMRKSSKIIVTIVIALIVVLVGGFGYIIVRDLKIEEQLKSEWEKLGYEETIDMNIYSSGDYAKVERQVKKDFQTLYEKTDDLLALFEDDRYTQLLTNQNYQKDGPNFENSFILLEDIGTKSSALIKEIEAFREDRYLEQQKKKIKADEYYQDYYLDVLRNETIYFECIDDVISSYQELSSTSQQMVQVLLFLREHQDQWYIENNVFTYYDEDFYEQYLLLLDDIPEEPDQNNSTL